MKELEIFLDRDCGDVLHGLNMAGCDALMPVKVRGSYRTIFLDHLAADGAGLTGLGNIQLVVVRVAHNDSLLLSISPEIPPTSGEIVFLSVTLV